MKEPFIVPKAPDLYTLLLREEKELGKVIYPETLSDDSTSSWVMEVVGPGHTVLLHNEAVATSEEYAALAPMRNRAILIKDIFNQRNEGRKTTKACEAFIADTKEILELIKHRHAEDLEQLKDDIIMATLVQNDIQRVEQLSNDLTRVVQEHKDVIQRHQSAINHCAKLIFTSSLTVTDNTLHQEFKSVEQSAAALMSEMTDFRGRITENQLPIVPSKSDTTVSINEAAVLQAAEGTTEDDSSEYNITMHDEISLSRATGISQAAKNSDNEAPENAGVLAQEELFVLEEIYFSRENDNEVKAISSPSDSKLSSGSEKSNRAIQLHESVNIYEYTQNVMISLRYWDRPEKSDLLAPFINYRAERAQAIKRLAQQLALSLALNHPEEERELLYRWIEICRGKSPQERRFNPEPLSQESLHRIQQDPVLREIYFKLPWGLQQDLNPKAEEYAQKIGIINSMWSIDDMELGEEQIARQWTNFINHEFNIIPELPEESSQYRLRDLMLILNSYITSPENADDATISLWKMQLKAAYKMYEVVKGIPSEERLLTQEPLTEAEYQLIQTHASFKPIFIALAKDERTHEKLRREHYKSVLLNVLAGKIASTPGLLNLQGNLSHDTQLNDDFLVRAGEEESVRGFRFLVEQDFFQYQLKYEANEKLIGILEDKGFSAGEARSVLGFMREQVVYSVFTYFLASRAQEARGQMYMVKGMPHYIHIYKEDGEIYFEINSSPWTFLRMDDMTAFPKQDNPEFPNIFFDAEFRLKYKLRPGRTVAYDTLQLVDVTTDKPASWQLLNFSSQEWKALPTIKRSILKVDKAMIYLSDADPVKQQQAKSTIELWLSDAPNPLHFKDYQLIEQHLISISQVDCLSRVIGKEWLEHSLQVCQLKIEECIEEQKRRGDEKPQYVFSDAVTPFDAYETVRDLMSQVPDTVAAAQNRIEQFLTLERPSIEQCAILHELLRSILSSTLVEPIISLSDIGSEGTLVQDKELKINRLWLEAQIEVCNKHIADAVNDAFNVPDVVAELMVAKTQAAAQQKIEKFLNTPRIEQAKYSDLAKRLMDFRIGLQAKGAASGVLDEDLIQWLDETIDCACGGKKESGVMGPAPAARVQQNSQSSLAPVESISYAPPATAPLGRRMPVSASMTGLMQRMSTTIFSIRHRSKQSSSSEQVQRKKFEGGPP